jgi:hypothetical protein
MTKDFKKIENREYHDGALEADVARAELAAIARVLGKQIVAVDLVKSVLHRARHGSEKEFFLCGAAVWFDDRQRIQNPTVCSGGAQSPPGCLTVENKTHTHQQL